jgi:hypothetical protein
MAKKTDGISHRVVAAARRETSQGAIKAPALPGAREAFTPLIQLQPWYTQGGGKTSMAAHS